MAEKSICSDGVTHAGLVDLVRGQDPPRWLGVGRVRAIGRRRALAALRGRGVLLAAFGATALVRLLDHAGEGGAQHWDKHRPASRQYC